MSLFDVPAVDDEVDDRPVHDHVAPMCVWCGQFVANERGWCSTCLDDEVR